MTNEQSEFHTRKRSLYCFQEAHPPDEYSIFERVEHIEDELENIKDQIKLIIKLMGQDE